MRRLLAAALAAALCSSALAASSPNPNGGASKTLAALTNTAVLVKGSPGLLATISCGNPNAAIEYVQFFDAATAGAVTVGTTPPKYFAALPVSNSFSFTVNGNYFTGIVVAATTTPAGGSAPGTPVNCSVTFQ